MGSPEPKRSTVGRLFAFSRNRCAFPGCMNPLFEKTGTNTGIICHIRARRRGGPRYDPKQSDEERHGYDNLILLCARHSKVIDSEPLRYTVELLQQLKAIHEKPGAVELSQAEGKRVDELLKEYREIHIHAQEILFARGKRAVIAPPSEAIGSDLLSRNYVKHLIDRYNDFASKQPGRKTFSFAAIHSSLKKRYGVSKWELIPIAHFDDACAYLQKRIDRTRLGSINRGNGVKNYSTFEEYRRKYYDRSETSAE